MPRTRTAQQFRYVAVRVRGVPAGPDLDVGDLRRGLRQPRQHVLERPVDEGFEDNTDPQLRGCGGTGHRRCSASPAQEPAVIRVESALGVLACQETVSMSGQTELGAAEGAVYGPRLGVVPRSI